MYDQCKLDEMIKRHYITCRGYMRMHENELLINIKECLKYKMKYHVKHSLKFIKF